MADEARSLKAYSELPENSELSLAISNSCIGKFLTLCLHTVVRVNETDTFADDEGLNDEYFDFEDISGAYWVQRHDKDTSLMSACQYNFSCALCRNLRPKTTAEKITHSVQRRHSSSFTRRELLHSYACLLCIDAVYPFPVMQCESCVSQF